MPSMSALSVFRSRVAMHAPTATDPMIDQAVLDTCIDFCDTTLVVKRMLNSFLTVANTQEYTPATPTDTSVAEFMRVWVDSTEITPLDEEGIQSPFGFVSTIPGQTNPPSQPGYFQETTPGSISFYPVPDNAYTINARAAMKPTRSATTVDSQLFEDWAEAIVSGALKRLYLTPGDLLNPAMAKKHEDIYAMWVGQAMLQARQGSVRAEQSVRPVRI